jgi:hypothetical protein
VSLPWLPRLAILRATFAELDNDTLASDTDSENDSDSGTDAKEGWGALCTQTDAPRANMRRFPSLRVRRNPDCPLPQAVGGPSDLTRMSHLNMKAGSTGLPLWTGWGGKEAICLLSFPLLLIMKLADVTEDNTVESG